MLNLFCLVLETHLLNLLCKESIKEAKVSWSSSLKFHAGTRTLISSTVGNSHSQNEDLLCHYHISFKAAQFESSSQGEHLKLIADTVACNNADRKS